jgi:hypothetical protein
MIEISGWALLGAIVGTAVAAANYFAVIGFVEKSLRSHDQSQTAEEREVFERKIGVMRRSVLALDILLFGGLGYWIGETLGG